MAMNEPHALYRMYDKDDLLLYVGITCNPSARFKVRSRRRSGVSSLR
jgi:hypothetical protein